MGERGNIKINDVWFYTHWEGYKTHHVVQQALIKGKGSWHDAPYLARIVFCKLIGKDINGTKNYGISTYKTDHNYPTMEIDVDRQKVRILEENADMVLKEWGFSEFVELILPEEIGGLVE